MLRQSRPPQIAVVRLRKGEWVLPKGKLDDGETPRAAAEREVLEETGHAVSVHEFLGTLAYDAGGRPKIVHYWRMETSGKPARDLMPDVIAVDWLPLNAAIERLSREHERAFLANVGPLAVEAARRPRQAKPAADKPRRRRVVAPKPVPQIASLPDDVVPLIESAPRFVGPDAPDVPVAAIEPEMADARTADADVLDADAVDVDAIDVDAIDVDATAPDETPVREARAVIDEPSASRITVIRRVRNWLGRAR